MGIKEKKASEDAAPKKDDTEVPPEKGSDDEDNGIDGMSLSARVIRVKAVDAREFYAKTEMMDSGFEILKEGPRGELFDKTR